MAGKIFLNGVSGINMLPSIWLVLQREFFNYLLNDWMTFLDTFPSLILDFISVACFESSKSGSIDNGEV